MWRHTYLRFSTDARRSAPVHAEAMDLDRTGPLWRQITAETIRRIEDGTYPPKTTVTGAWPDQCSSWVAARSTDAFAARAAKPARP